MNRDNDQDDKSSVEDYGGPADYDESDQQSNTQGSKYSGGMTGTSPGNSEGEQFGDFDRTGTGVDLTEEMEGTDARTGLVKGGEHDADDVAGPAQYGGETGGLNKQG